MARRDADIKGMDWTPLYRIAGLYLLVVAAFCAAIANSIH